MATRQNKGDVKLPEGFSLVNGSMSIKGQSGGMSGTDIYPNNHNFAFYDEQFYGILAKYLHDHDDISLLDIGGGKLSLAVQHTMQKFPYVKAMNIDLLAEDTLFSRQGNAAKLQIDDNSIDALVSVNSIAYFLIQSFTEAQKIIGEMTRVLKPGGYVFISPGVDLTRWSSQLEAVIDMYGKNTFGKVYTNRNLI